MASKRSNTMASQRSNPRTHAPLQYVNSEYEMNKRDEQMLFSLKEDPERY